MQHAWDPVSARHSRSVSRLLVAGGGVKGEGGGGIPNGEGGVAPPPSPPIIPGIIPGAPVPAPACFIICCMAAFIAAFLKYVINFWNPAHRTTPRPTHMNTGTSLVRSPLLLTVLDMVGGGYGVVEEVIVWGLSDEPLAISKILLLQLYCDADIMLLRLDWRS